MSHIPRKFALTCLDANIPVAGLLAATAVTANAQTTTAAARTSASAGAEVWPEPRSKRLSLIGHHSADRPTGHGSPGKVARGLTDVQSHELGYAYVRTPVAPSAGSPASWTEPSATCSRSTEQLAAFWVGIDVYSSSERSSRRTAPSSSATGATLEVHAGGRCIPRTTEMMAGQARSPPHDAIASTVTAHAVRATRF